MMPRGACNVWVCDTCGGGLFAVHLAAGVTPAFLACRDAEGCGGRMSSRFYRAPVDVEFLDVIGWEWREASQSERKRWKREKDHHMLRHVEQGGLVLGVISDEGRALVDELRNNLEIQPEEPTEEGDPDVQ